MNLKIKGREFILSQRRAVDVLDLFAAAKTEDADGTMQILRMGQVVSDSLRATHLSLGRIRGYHYGKYIGKHGVQSLLDDLSLPEISSACEMVAELEGVKKKVIPQAVSASGERSAVD
jgi:hypothetical protein